VRRCDDDRNGPRFYGRNLEQQQYACGNDNSNNRLSDGRSDDWSYDHDNLYNNGGMYGHYRRDGKPFTGPYQRT
jgi:hypothetical protein